MSIKLDAKSRKVIKFVEKLDTSMETQLKKALYFIGKKLRSTASENIKKRGRRGRVYRHKGRRHVSSVEGESWANKSGKARRGIIYRVASSKKLVFGNTVEHAEYLEDGTKKMKPRPAHLISLQQNNRNIVWTLKRNIRKAFES